MTAWYDSGEKLLEMTLVDGIPHGISTVWDKNGQKRIAILFVRGKREGPYSDIQNGDLIVGAYHDDNMVGHWRHWESGGKQLSDANYVDGNFDGLVVVWYHPQQGGNIAHLQQWDHGIQNGREVLYEPAIQPDGRLPGKPVTRIRKNGEIISTE